MKATRKPLLSTPTPWMTVDGLLIALIATLLLEKLDGSHPMAKVKGFEFKAVSPLFDSVEFDLCGLLEGSGATLRA
jgi:hydroxyacyl-ACP dehydratase HTD2-like protein with hotdog domain